MTRRRRLTFTFDVTLTTTDIGTTQDDYTVLSSSATFVASDFSQTDVNGQQRYRATSDFTVAIIDDTADEPEEAFRVRLAYLTPGLTHLKGGPATAVVTIDDDDPPEVSGMAAVNYAENDSGRVAAYSATNPERATLTWSLSGDDADDFSISKTGNSAGSLTFKTSPDYENPQDRYTPYNEYDVTVQASDGTATGILEVTVTVTNANEAPEFPATETGARSVPENMAGVRVGAPVEAEDDDNGDMLTYSLSGGGASSFEIDTTSGQLETRVSLNYEARNSYTVTVIARDMSDATDTIRVTITVTDENDAGEVTLSPVQPRVGARLTATLTDPDGSISGESWAWESYQDQTNWSFIGGANSNSYTPDDSDAGKIPSGHGHLLGPTW